MYEFAAPGLKILLVEEAIGRLIAVDAATVSPAQMVSVKSSDVVAKVNSLPPPPQADTTVIPVSPTKSATARF
jgi:hypothetical protein